MSILSTNKKLISIGAEYSAGQGIDITNHIISVVESAVGEHYSAGPNIDIYDVDGQPTISSKDWTNDIEQASANAYEEAIAQIPEPQDLSYLSARTDANTSGIDYISSVCITAHQDWTDTIKGASSYSYEQSTSYFDNWISGQYTGDITNITNKITALSGDLSGYYKKTETSSKDEINDALQYVSANAGKVYEGISPIVVNNVEDKISADTWTFSAGSNVSFVDDNVNKITRIDVELPQPQDLSYISAQVDSANAGVDYLSGVVITALPSDLATTGDIADLAQSVSETYQTKGDYLVRSDSANFYPMDGNPSGFLTAHQSLSNYYTKDETSGKEELASAFANIPVGDPEVNAYVTSNSASIDESTDLVQSNSSTWNDVTAYQSNSANYITAHQSLEGLMSASLLESADGKWTAYNSIPFKAGDEFPASADEAIQAYQTNSSTYLTSHQDISNLMPKSESANFYPMTGNPSGFINTLPEEEEVEFEEIDLSSFATSSQISALSGAIDYVSANAGGTTLTGDAQGAVDNVYSNSGKYVLNTATDCGIGNGCTATNNSLAQGYINSAKQTSFAQGMANTAVSNSLAQGTQNSANDMSFAQGKSACAYNHSLAQGYMATAMWNSVSVGNGSLAKGQSIAVGDHNQAESNSQAFGNHVSATNSGMAIGTYNNITTGAFVIGNGTSNGNRSDSFIIFHDGSVSAAGKISANGVELGGGVTGEFVPLSSFNELKQSYDALSSLFATYSGQWLLPNEGV